MEPCATVVIHSDSQVIIGHVSDDYEAKGDHMNKCLSLVKCHVGTKLEAKFVHSPREREYRR